MLKRLAKWYDNFMGRDEASIAIPVFDGALKPNRILEDAETVVEFDDPEDLVSDGHRLFVADGSRIFKVEGGQKSELQDFGRRITALACLPGGGFAVALDGTEVVIQGGGEIRCRDADGKAFRAINAISVTKAGNLLASDGSSQYAAWDWAFDLMTLGQTGRLVEIDVKSGKARVVKQGLKYAFGVLEFSDRPLVSESWRHQVVGFGKDGSTAAIVDQMPGYPCRMSRASDGGVWLSVFSGRTQLIEFVLREPGYRRRMVAEIDPRYWIAPAFNSGETFLEPLQGAGVKMRGVKKPWAPARSYGLVIKLSATGELEFSYHSRQDGSHHGIVSSVELDGQLFALSKGSGKLLKMSNKALGE